MNLEIALILEYARNLLQSSDSDSSDDDENELLLLIGRNNANMKPHIRCQNYIDVVALYTDEQFRMHFRMQRRTFRVLLDLLMPDLTKQSDRYGRDPVSPEKQLLVAIWIMATPSSYRCVSDRFDVGKATAWRTVRKVVNALYKRAALFIKWPSVDEAQANMDSIQHRYSFPGVIGAVAGTHIKITAPKYNSAAYVNRKGFHSMQLQVICDPQLKFIQCYTGQVGSVHDMRVFRLSNVENIFNNVNFSRDSHILGDAAYQISKYVMVPFKDNGHLSDAQIKFNFVHSSSRMIVERSLRLLKARFRSLLDTLPMRRTDLTPKYKIACCIMHNICLLQDDIIDIPLIVNEANLEQRGQMLDDNAHREGIDKRNAIMYALQNI